MILTDVKNVSKLKATARSLGVKAEGDQILILTGDADSLKSLDIDAGKDFAYIVDAPLHLEKQVAFNTESEALYLAKKDFGILEFWKNHPEADGRNVTVGILDDGISPHQTGFTVTTTGERKFLKKGSNSTYTTFDLVETETGFSAEIDENRPSFSILDLNADDLFNSWTISVNKEGTKACIDEICKGSFSKTGEFFFAKNPLFTIMVEIDITNKKIQIFQPEMGGDSHGEGVASVLAGYRIGNLPGFDGVAPGAKIVDYDLSEMTDKAVEQEYTISTFLKGLDWLGTNGAEVANISYSFGFTSAETQIFMNQALTEIIKKHNMVISFSAGNNGPGLGSLNRRSIYPATSLVAGAFISKELDERVHGVTGIPDEGRVVFYSSRGPGMGGGPTLISPLSSLTQSSPDEGHMAFSGTSSASPALAGAAAVLISGIKQLGLKVDAPTVVHALRLSGKRLKNEPFIFQGAGLPQMEAALAIYAKLIKGEAFQNVLVEVNKENLDEVASAGILIKASQVRTIETRYVLLKGVVSELASPEAKVNLLVPIRLEYSAGLSGPRELWVSSSESGFSVDVAIKEILTEGQNESFGEIKIFSTLDNSYMASVPVTVINDVNILARPSVLIKVNAQEGKRFHLNIPEGIKAFKIKAEVVEGNQRGVSLSVFDTNQIRLLQQRTGADIWVPVTRAGFYQVGISMNGGTATGALVKIEMEILNLKLKTTMVKAGDADISIENASPGSVSGILVATLVPEVVKSMLVTSDFAEGTQEFTETLNKGDYKIELVKTQKYDLSYFFPNCSIIELAEDGTFTISDSTEISVEETKKATFRCTPFDFGMSAETEVNWLMRLLKVSKPIETRLDIAPGSRKEISVKELKAGRYSIGLKSPFDEETEISLGEIDVI